jgi:hypothetical protein
MNMAAIALAACSPLLLAPDRNDPMLATLACSCRPSGLTRSTRASTARGSVTSAVTRLPRVRIMFTCEAFLSVAKLASNQKRRTVGIRSRIQLQAANVARPTMF